MKKIIRHDDKIYIVDRMLVPTTKEDDADRIHKILGTDTLLRDNQGNWFCCNTAKEVEFRDIVKPVVPLTAEDFEHTQFELGDHGGLG